MWAAWSRIRKTRLQLVPSCLTQGREVPFVFDVVGDGGAREQLDRAISALGLAEPTRFWGWLDRDGVRDRLAALDVLILLSAFEGLPVALLEAMGQGVVPIVTRIASGSPDVVRDGINGFLVPVGNISLFGDRVSRVARDRQLRIRMGRAAWETASSYSVGRMVEASLRHRGSACGRPPGTKGPGPVPHHGIVSISVSSLAAET